MNADSRRLHDLVTLNRQYDANAAGVADLMAQQGAGRDIDPAAFTDMLSRLSVCKTALGAQTQLHKNPLQVVMAEMGR